jgi:4'-phosphopantetheinyl transferase
MTDDVIDVAWLRLDCLTPRQLSLCDSLLDQSEHERSARFHFEADRDRFITRRALLRLMLSRHAAVAPSCWRFAAGAHGKPFIAYPLRTGLHFNLSHSKGVVASAVTRAGEIGLDIEAIDPHYRSLQVAQFGFAREEREALRDTAPSLRPRAFTALWVLKEAYVKALGEGLSIPLDSFAVALDPPALLRTAHGLGGPRDWRFHLYHPTPHHLVALAWPRRLPARVAITEWTRKDVEASVDILLPDDAKDPTRQHGAWGLRRTRSDAVRR